MKHFKFINFSVLLFLLCASASVVAQTTKTAKEEQAGYKQVLQERAAKIVQSLEISSDSKSTKVRELIASQYFDLNTIQTKRDEQLKSIGNSNPAKTAAIKNSADLELKKLHTKYLSKLGRYLSQAQIEKVKDGMTYNVVPLTFANYLLQTPYLTQAQQDKIKGLLIEARELAMDGSSSKEKHAWFGKYKGKITNYLAAEGFDMKKESADWAKRRDTSSTAIEIVQSNKVTKALDIKDKSQSEAVRNLIAHQYQKIQEMIAERDAKMKAASQQPKSKEENDKAASDIWASYQSQLHDQRKLFLKKLSTLVDSTKVELAQNEMTDHRLQQEYTHFQALLPNLSTEQKKQVYDYLSEARDNAMNVLDEGGRLKWFIKFRGRANNYLAKAGYNLRKATEELEAKLQTEKIK